MHQFINGEFYHWTGAPELYEPHSDVSHTMGTLYDIGSPKGNHCILRSELLIAICLLKARIRSIDSSLDYHVCRESHPPSLLWTASNTILILASWVLVMSFHGLAFWLGLYRHTMTTGVSWSDPHASLTCIRRPFHPTCGWQFGGSFADRSATHGGLLLSSPAVTATVTGRIESKFRPKSSRLSESRQGDPSQWPDS